MVGSPNACSLPFLQFFMVDKSKAEINAVTEVFPADTRLLLCDFHRTQAWWRWIQTDSNGIPAEQKRSVFQALAYISNALTPSDFQTRVQNFKVRYASFELLQKYMEEHWLNCTALWVKCYRLGGAQGWGLCTTTLLCTCTCTCTPPLLCTLLLTTASTLPP